MNRLHTSLVRLIEQKLSTIKKNLLIDSHNLLLEAEIEQQQLLLPLILQRQQSQQC